MPQIRQLAAIMFTDIVGYTALMGDDEHNAFQILNKSRAIQKPAIQEFGGRWIKELGDGVMATFSTVTDAVMAAVSIQQSCSKVEGLKLRIGIHLAEVMFENNDVFGDGVNIASRIQAIAPVGAIWVSDAVQKNISNKKGIETKFVREEKLKNVKEPVQVYEVNIDSVHLVHIISATSPAPKPIIEKSIAVLPFSNMSGDPEQEYFSDGIAEEILTSLSHLKDLKVVSRSSSFQFKGKAIDLHEVGEKLGVTTVLEGSIRRQGNRVRITTQLINVSNGFQLWSDKYDRQMDDIFAIQDEIALAITEKLKITLFENEKQVIVKPTTENLEAYELYLKGRYYWNKRGRWLVNGLQFFQQAIAIDPNLAKAYAGIADAYSALGLYGMIAPHDAMPKAKAAALKAIELDPSISEAFTSMGFINGIYENDLYLANKNFKHALEKNPGYATGHYWYSFYLSIVEKDLKKAEEEGLMSTALEPENAIAYHITGLAFLAQRKFDEAINQANKAIEIDATLFLPYFLIGWCYIEKGELPKAIEYLNTSLNLSARHAWPLGFMVFAKARSGNMDEAKVLVNEIVEREKTQYMSTFGAVIGAAAINDIDLVIELLEKGYRNKDILIQIFAHLQVMPENLKTNQRFLDFLKNHEFA
ncbi:MAG: adenylate/guanylate cyclase domain-containing protein [Panacibacter sp.]